MHKGYQKIFWGIFLATFNIKLGSIKILPSFIAFIIVSSGISYLLKDYPSKTLEKAQTFARLLIALSFIGESASFIIGYREANFILIQIWPVIFSIFELLMVYKILEGSVEYLSAYLYMDIAEEYTKKIRVYIILFIVMEIYLCFVLTFNAGYLIIFGAIAAIILRIWFMIMINHLKKVTDTENKSNPK
ncbi:hypothetical protein [Brassicibacter mesophilus]|uniref:hypothetical protein n=1 Tax=Brassicibacter mesophilus TaxID=745119 RepID=UPI003D2633C2